MKLVLINFLLAAVFLAGCSDPTNEAIAEVEEKQEQNIRSKEQQELISTYKGFIEENNYYSFLNDFNKRFNENKSEIEINDEIIAAFNDGVVRLMKDEGPEKYKNYKIWIHNEFLTEETALTIEEINETYTDQAQEKLIEFIKEVYNDNFSKDIIDGVITSGFLADNEEIQTLKTFSDALQPNSSEWTLLNVLKRIDPYYRGPVKKELDQFMKDNEISLSYWVNVYNEANGTNLTDRGKGEYDYNPAIGMTAEEVEKSTWGKPKSINRTVTAYSVREQWVYSNARYLYFEDGILTSFQD